jgi:hypothetical protein
MLKWEEIQQDDQIICMKRIKVIGGWIVQATMDALTPQYQGYDTPVQEHGYQWRTSITFVPDPNHEWKL